MQSFLSWHIHIRGTITRVGKIILDKCLFVRFVVQLRCRAKSRYWETSWGRWKRKSRPARSCRWISCGAWSFQGSLGGLSEDVWLALLSRQNTRQGTPGQWLTTTNGISFTFWLFDFLTFFLFSFYSCVLFHKLKKFQSLLRHHENILTLRKIVLNKESSIKQQTPQPHQTK